MLYRRDPRWLIFLSRWLGWMAIPNLAIVLIALQAGSYLISLTDPRWTGQIILIPDLVWRGEIWRLVSFLAIPISRSPLGLIFSLWFGFSIINSIEDEWGSFKTTFYLFISVLLTILFSLTFDYTVLSVAGFGTTLFLAAATLFPENQIQIYFMPVKMKVLGFIAGAFTLYEFVQGSWMDRFFLLVIYANYILFFGPLLVYQIKEWKRRNDYKSRWR